MQKGKSLNNKQQTKLPGEGLAISFIVKSFPPFLSRIPADQLPWGMHNAFTAAYWQPMVEHFNTAEMRLYTLQGRCGKSCHFFVAVPKKWGGHKWRMNAMLESSDKKDIFKHIKERKKKKKQQPYMSSMQGSSITHLFKNNE